MLVGETWPATADGLASDGYRMLLSKATDGQHGPIRSGAGRGVLGRWVSVTGDSIEDPRRARLAATDDLEPGPSILEQPVTVRCGEGGTVLPGARM